MDIKTHHISSPPTDNITYPDTENNAAELLIANRKLALLIEENEKRAAELVIANRELTFQNSEKEKRTEELRIANIKLTFENAQKEKRAHEAIKANRELIQTQAQLSIVNKELEAFSYSVSHDLRAPLRAISGYSNILKEDYSDKLDKEANRLIDVIVDKAQMMSSLIDDLLSFSKMARLEKVNSAVDMKKLTEKCFDEIRHDFPKPSVIKIGDLPVCNGDEAMLKQLWLNLISNAVKYSSKKTNAEIEIGAESKEDSVVYFIKDNGTGFDMKYSDKLFGVFQRLHRQDEFDGTGLGLALAKRIVNKHNGEIWSDSQPGAGATFYFSIPKNIINE